MRACVIALAAVVLAICGLGCASDSHPVSIPIWQESVEDYIWTQANGDPNCLRDTTWAATRKGFAILGDPIPADSTDANGILLAHREVGGRMRFIFLVGLVREQSAQDIRIAAMSFEDGQVVWALSQPNEQAVEMYRSYRERTWRGRYAGREELPLDYKAFPAMEDVFELSVEGGRVVVTHRQSGARWELAMVT